MNEQPVTIIGVALNGKAGALVKATDGKVYYIEGLSVWPSDIHNKQVTVSGFLKVETYSESDLKDAQGDWKQGLAGQIKVIQHAQWKAI